MRQPLALRGEGFHFAWMKAFFALCFALSVAAPSFAQQADEQSEPSPPPSGNTPQLERTPRGTLPFVIEPPLEALPAPALPPDRVDPDDPDPNADTLFPNSPPLAPDGGALEAPDYSRLSSSEERAARLDDMFSRLAAAQSEDDGTLIAEEIWSLWLDSGSASVNLILRRGSRAQTSGNNAMARRMFDHVTDLSPDYAEGWARSSRLALEERDFARAASEAVRALTHEPRHFYALWTLGNVLERLGRAEDALDAYREANQLYPALKSVADRVEALELRLGGGVL